MVSSRISQEKQAVDIRLAEMAFPLNGHGGHGDGADPEAPATEVTSSRVGNAKGGEFFGGFHQKLPRNCRFNMV